MMNAQPARIVPTAEIPAHRRNWLVVGALAAIALTSCTLVLHALEHVMDAALALVAAGKGIALARLIAALGLEDVTLAALTLVLIAAVVLWERRSRALSLFVASIDRAQGFVLLSLVLAWCGQAYLSPGVLLGGDTGSHIARFLEMRRGFDAGTLAQWTNYDYLGSPLLGFTGPLTYIVGGALDVVVRDPVTTAKILLFCSHLAAGWLFYALLLRLAFAPLPSLVAATGFAGSFALLHLFLYRGVFPQQFTILFLVLVFYAAEGLMRGLPSRGRDWLLFALSTAGLIVNHQPHALFVGFYLGLFGAASLIVGRWPVARLWLPVTAGLMGAAIAVFAVVPIAAESNWVMIDPEGGLLRFHLPTLERLVHLVLWRDTRTTWGIDYWAYLGIVSVGLAGLGAWASLSRRLGDDRRGLALVLLPCITVSFFLYNPVVRDVIFIVFFAGLYAALGMEWLAAHARPGGRIALFVVIAAILDVASTSIQPVARRDKQFLIDAGQYLEAKAANERIVEIDLPGDGSFAANIGPGSTTISYYSTVQRVAGDHNMAATRVHNYAVTVVKLAEHELRRDGHLSHSTESLLGILNVSRIVCFGPFVNTCPARFAGTEFEPPLGAVIHLPNASPVLFSRTLTLLAPPAGLDKPMLWEGSYNVFPPFPQVTAVGDFLQLYLRALRLEPGSHVAASLPVRALPDPAPAAAPGDASAWHPRLTSYRVGLQHVAMTVDSDGPGYAQLAHPWYPASAVRINGRPVAPIDGSIDLIVVPLAAGENVIEIDPVVTPIRAASNIVSGLSLVLALFAAVALGLGRASRKATGPAEAETADRRI